MKILHFDDVYRQINTSSQSKFAWLHDNEQQWALRIPVSREDSAEYTLLKRDVSIHDAVSPSTLPFIAQFMNALGVRAASVEIRTLFERAFYGMATFEREGETFEVSGRIGLLVALSLRFACPIVIEEELLERTGVRLPSQSTLREWLAEEQSRVYQKVSLPHTHTPVSTSLESFIRQGAGQALTAEQMKQVQAEIQQGLGPEQREQFRQFYNNLTPEGKKMSQEMWRKLGFAAPPFPEGVVEDNNDPNTR